MDERIADLMRDHFERLDRLHRATDNMTFPFAQLDRAVHGGVVHSVAIHRVSRSGGLLNWGTDTHLEEIPKPFSNTYTIKSISPPPPPPPPIHYSYAPTWPPQYNFVHHHHHHYDPPPPQTPPSQPPHPNHNSGGHTNTGSGNNSSGQSNDGAIKVANFGSS
ncbi:hypothetical protein JCGZ_00563 [Jatropha curcas]|uniref:Uncharacterized protein n=1 Tax=Jatropha curcas TaxID=180498 RepID=A0A067JD62_JATCU|nr:hypothetical protein JCGZ_00563 [Jatropha curcas]